MTNKETYFKILKEIAKNRSGTLLSEKYINNNTKMKFCCSSGHEWLAFPYNIKRGCWCPVCCYEKQKASIEKMQKLAETRDGKCLSKKYINSWTHLRWLCKDGHVWEASPANIKTGHWCPTCGQTRQGLHKYSINDMQKLAETREGKCLSTEYINNRTKLKWVCKNGHIWEASPDSINGYRRSHGSWCPICANRKKLTIEYVKDQIENKLHPGSKLISAEYKSNSTKLELICETGHPFEMRWTSINNGHWCPYCCKYNQH